MFPPETISLGPARAALNVFGTINRASDLAAWNGSAWVSNTNLDLVQGAVTGTSDQNGNVGLAIPAAITVQFVILWWLQGGGSPSTGDMVAANYLGSGSNGAYVLGPNQSNDNTGQTTPLPTTQLTVEQVNITVDQS